MSMNIIHQHAMLTPLLCFQVSGGLRGNWPAFWSAAVRDHSHAGLIWNESTRRELRDALERELAGLKAARTRVAKVGMQTAYLLQ